MAENRLIRHILEVRLKNRLFAFSDFRGEMVDYLIADSGFDQVKLTHNGTRFDLTNEKKDKFYFASIENFGFQSEANTDFASFKVQAKELFDRYAGFQKYQLSNGLVRIGTKCVILDKVFGLNLRDLKQKYDEVVFGNGVGFLNRGGATVSDTTSVFDVKMDKSKINIISGVVTKEEALQKFFDNKERQYDFGHGHGLLFAIDASYNDVAEVSDWEGLTSAINEQITDIETTFDRFREQFPAR